MPIITESAHIPGVLIVRLKPFADVRGRRAFDSDGADSIGGQVEIKIDF